MILLSIIVPCYNEADNLVGLIAKCEELVKANAEIEIILVDNGSVDSSPKVINDLLSVVELSNLRTYRVPVNKGYGNGILEGLNNANGNFLCWTHADLQTDIFDCVKALKIYNQQCSENIIVKGRRKGRKLLDVFFTLGMQLYVLLKLGVNLSDINAQPKLFSKKFYQLIKNEAPFDFSLDLYFLIKAKELGKIVEFPVYFKKRVAGEAKGGSGNLKLKVKLLKRTAAFINAFKKHS